MVLAPRLELRQGQALVMTPQLQQAIKLLQLSNIELSAFVEQELEKNPLLERDESRENAPEAPAENGGDSEITLPEGTLVAADHKISEDSPPADAEKVLDTDYDNLYSEDSPTEAAVEPAAQGPTTDWSQAGSGGSTSFDGSAPGFEETLAGEVTLKDHLTDQLNIALKAPADRLIGAHLIDLVDESGYVTEDVATIAERLGTDFEDVDAVLGVMQKFDPPGIMAHDLKSCLSAQLADMDRLDPVMQLFLDNLELLAKRDMEGLMRTCSVDAEDIASMVADIRMCNPKPGLAFGSDVVQPVVPDVYVRPTQQGGWAVELNSDTLPRVLVNTQYYSEVAKNASGDDKAYMSDCLNSASWLVKSLDQRARTILKVSTEIVRQQDAFLANGVQYLRPLNLRTIADAISMHESTVSRVTANKYMATPRGVYELKYFFTSAIASSAGGEAHSAEAVRHRIKVLIEGESAKSVLSDDKIVELLKEAGIDIARRTVAKYREAMKIPSSVQRRREKKAMA